MKLSRVFRQTLHITNATRTDGDGMCASSPQVYRRSLSTFQVPRPEIHQLQEVYEDVDSAWRRPPLINDLKIVGGKHPPATNGPNPVNMTSSPILDAAKDKRKEKVQKGPLIKALPSMASLGPPPPKPPRPLNVDLSTFFHLQQNGVSSEPEESSEVEYEQTTLSPTLNEDYLYDEAFSPKDSPESDSNAYELDDVGYDPTSRPETADGCIYEVSVDNSDLSYSSTMSSYPSTKSSVSEGYYSADLDTSNESFRKERKSKELEMQKSGHMLLKRFKISGREQMLYRSRIIEDFKAEKYSLPGKKGDTVEVIRISDCPAGKCLARDAQGKYGLVPVTGLQTINDTKTFSNQHPVCTSADQEVYADVEVRRQDSGPSADKLKSSDSYSRKSDDHYDDICNMSQASNGSGGKVKVFGHLFKKDKSKQDDGGYLSVFPDLNRTASKQREEKTCAQSDEQEREKEEKFLGWKSIFHKIKEQKGTERNIFSPASGLKKFAKEEKIFREKFKYMGEINVVNIATVNDQARFSPRDKLELSVKPRETVEVIDVTSENKIICRNFAGKYGYVRIDCLNF